MSGEYVLRQTSAIDYQIEDPDGNVLASTTYQSKPDIPHDIVDDLVSYAFNQAGSFDDVSMQELAKMQLLGFRYVDDS